LFACLMKPNNPAIGKIYLLRLSCILKDVHFRRALLVSVITRPRIPKYLPAAILCIFIISANSVIALARYSGDEDISVSDESIEIFPRHPEINDIVKLTATISNYGSEPTTADVLFYNGPPGMFNLIGSCTVLINPGTTFPASIQWNTTGVSSGFHKISVWAKPISPDSDIDPSNNNASFWMAICNPVTCIRVNGAEFREINGPLVLRDILGVWEMGKLTLDNATIYFAQSFDYQYGIFLDDQGILDMQNTLINSNYKLLILVSGTSNLSIVKCNVTGKIMTRERTRLSVSDSILEGGLELRNANITMSQTVLSGGIFSFRKSNMTVDSSDFSSATTLRIDSSIIHAKDTTFTIRENGSPVPLINTLNVTGSSNVSLTAVVSGSINVIEQATVSIFRYLTMRAEDLCQLAIPNASLIVSSINESGVPLNGATNTSGNATFTVITDIILPGTVPKAIGVYNVTGTYGDLNAQTNIQMPCYPNMTFNSTHAYRNITFQMNPPNRPPSVYLVYPLNNSIINTTSVRLLWTGTDPDGDSLNYTIRLADTAEMGSFILACHTKENRLELTNLSDGAIYFWTVQAEDGRCNCTDVQVGIWSFRVEVPVPPPPVNHPPRITSTPPLNATAGQEWFYSYTAIDDDGDLLIWTVEKAPEGLMFAGGAGWMAWVPLKSQNGTNAIVLKVTDQHGAYDVQEIQVNVTVIVVPEIPPVCTITNPANGATVRNRITVTGTAVAGSSVLRIVEVRLDGGNWTAVSGLDEWQFGIDTKALKNGAHRLEARAGDGLRYSNVTGVTLVVSNPVATATTNDKPICLPMAVIAILAGASVILFLRKREK